MSDKPTHIRLIQAASIFTSSTAAGGSLALTFFVIPRLLESPTPLMLKQWHRMFLVSKRVFPGLAGVSGTGYLVLASQFEGNKARLYALSAMLCFGIVPYTFALIMKTNQKLLALVQDAGDAKTDDSTSGKIVVSGKRLVDNWGTLNLGRGIMVALGSAIALWNSL